MHIEIKRGKEIHFVESLNTYLHTINNDQQSQNLIDCFDFTLEDFKSILKTLSKIDLGVISTIFERINYRQNTQTNNAGKKYLAFSTKNFSSFITSPQGIKLFGLYALWNVINYNSNKVHFKSQILNAYFFYLVMMEFEGAKINHLNEYFNSPDIKNQIIKTFPQSILSFNPETHQYYTHNQSWLLQTDTNAIFKALQEEDTAIYVKIHDIIYRIKSDYDGYEVSFTECTNQIETSYLKEMHFSTGIFIPYDDEEDLEITLFYKPERAHIIGNIQKLYDSNIKLFNLSPQSENSNTKKKAENTFISLIHKIVEETLQKRKATPHIIQTITGLITYDFKIIELDTKLMTSDYSKEDSDKLRKKVNSSINSNNKLSL